MGNVHSTQQAPAGGLSGSPIVRRVAEEYSETPLNPRDENSPSTNSSSIATEPTPPALSYPMVIEHTVDYTNENLVIQPTTATTIKFAVRTWVKRKTASAGDRAWRSHVKRTTIGISDRVLRSHVMEKRVDVSQQALQGQAEPKNVDVDRRMLRSHVKTETVINTDRVPQSQHKSKTATKAKKHTPQRIGKSKTKTVNTNDRVLRNQAKSRAANSGARVLRARIPRVVET